MFFANPPPVERMRINHFLKVEPPIGRMLIDLENRMTRFDELVESEVALFANDVQDESEEITIVANAMNENTDINPIEKGVSALLAFHNRNELPAEEQAAVAAEEQAQEQEAVDAGRINLFSKVALPDKVQKLVGAANFERFSLPLVSKAMVKDKVELLERVMGKPGSQAVTITNEIIKDMLTATDYPPEVGGLLQDPATVAETARDLCEYLQSLQSAADD
jgi:intracellular multiplication protein IcmO